LTVSTLLKKIDKMG